MGVDVNALPKLGSFIAIALVLCPFVLVPAADPPASAAGAKPLSEEQKADALRDAYTFLRRAELRLQIAHEYSAPAVRKNSKEWTAWTRAVFPDETGAVAAERFEKEWSTHTQTARGIFEKVRDEL